MNEAFVDILVAGGRSNSLGRAGEVIEAVLRDRSRLEELYDCLFDNDAWVRMRAIDTLEKICRQHPDWLLPYIDRFNTELSDSTQPSIQWHLAEMYAQVELTDEQKRFAMNWLTELLSRKDADWIVAANSMKTLFEFARKGDFSTTELKALLEIQQHHKSNAVKKRASKLLSELS